MAGCIPVRLRTSARMMFSHPEVCWRAALLVLQLFIFSGSSTVSIDYSANSQEQIDLHFVYRYNQIAWGKQGWVRQS
jgi:hypothetical protein